ncbi:hypothetical protein CPB84DRAFT_1757751 [Gymnopilus junonius]|uniref:RING-type domain-containing protein n=1 Tax=Gymnopilus junonius TaxID=109634 RepID=A0A9P5TU53_GYMJU|nr:hypothetical protein CPB84DRAFT_1757751 [Gymnopilus junonius]
MDTPTREALYQSAFRQMLDLLAVSMPGGLLSQSQIQKLLDDLPRIEEKKLLELGEKDSFCPICYTPYFTILTEEEMALALDSPAHPVEELGVTKLAQPWQCGHMFCRRDISKWINDGHDSCPMCRRLLVEVQEQTAGNDADMSGEEQQRTLSENFEAAMSRLGEFHTTNNASIPDNLNRLFADLSGAETEGDRQEYSGMYS